MNAKSHLCDCKKVVDLNIYSRGNAEKPLSVLGIGSYCDDEDGMCLNIPM